MTRTWAPPKTARLLRVIAFCALALGLMACGDLAVFLSQPQNIQTSDGFQSIEVGEDGYFHIAWDFLGNNPNVAADYDLYLLKTIEVPQAIRGTETSLRLSNGLVTVTQISKENSLSLSDYGQLIANLKGLSSYSFKEKIDPKAHYIFSIRSKSSAASARNNMVCAKVNFAAPSSTRSSWNRDNATVSWEYVAGASSYAIYDAKDLSTAVATSASSSVDLKFSTVAEAKDFCVRSLRGALVSEDCSAIEGIGNQWKTQIAELSAFAAPSGYYRVNDDLDLTLRFTNPISIKNGATVKIPLYMGTIANASYLGGSGTDTLSFRYRIVLGNKSNGLLPLPELLVTPKDGIIDALGKAVDTSFLKFHYEKSSSIKIDADPPTVHVGADRQAILPFAINATTNDAVNLSWSQISGPGTAHFNPTDKANTEFSADGDGTYLIRLTVEDDSGLSAYDEVEIEWDNTAPIVNVGADRSFRTATLINATSSGGSTYQWSKISGPGAISFGTPAAEDTTVSASAEGVYVLRLTVTDALGNVGFDELTMTWDITAPIADAGPDRSEGGPFELMGSSNETSTFAWTVVTKPGASVVTFSSANTASTGFSGTVDGSYVLRLTATDAAGNSTSDTMALLYNALPPTFSGINSMVISPSKTEVTLGWATANDLVTTRQKMVYDICHSTTPGVCATSFLATYTSGHARLNYTVRGLNPSGYNEFLVRARDEKLHRDSNVVLRKTGVFTGAVSVSAGKYFNCSVTSDAKVRCWGYNSSGELGNGTYVTRSSPSEVLGLTNVTAVATGDAHACALISDGTVSCWGYNNRGQLGIGNTTSRNTPIAVPGLTGVTSIYASYRQTCAITSAPAAYCWGGNTLGVLGDGTTTNRSVPTLVTVTTGITAFGMGNGHTCAIIANGEVSCWGNNASYQLGDGTATSRLTAASVTGITGASFITSSQFQNCVLIGSGARCWGDNYYGALGDSTNNTRTTPVTPTGLSSGVLSISAKSGSVCAILSPAGNAKCWGFGEQGQLGHGLSKDYKPNSPENVVGISGAVAMSSNYDHSCIVLSDSKIKCWGDNSWSVLGTEFDALQLPRNLPNLPNDMIEVVSGAWHACALSASGKVYCWGASGFGQLGDGTYYQRGIPSEVSGISTATALAIGMQHSCALLADKTVKCWGQNNIGQLGDGTTSDKNTPQTVVGLSDVKGIVAGNSRTCAVLTDGSAKCWGNGTNGAIGNGQTSNQTAPTVVLGLTDVKYLTTGTGATTCAHTNAGPAYCWGDNTYGQIGDGTTTHRSVPTLVTNVSGIKKIVTGSVSTCALLNDKSLKCWGSNSDGQLGNNSNTDSVAAVSVQNMLDAEDISLFGRHACAMTTSDVTKCWGQNVYAQLGDATGTARPAPISLILGDIAKVSTGAWHSCGLHTDKTVSCWGANPYSEIGAFETYVPWEVSGE